MSDNDYVLYLLLRKDMDSLLHVGKAIAQAAHAANHAAWSIGKGLHGPKAMAQFSDWEKQTDQGFGTTIVYGGIIKAHRHAPRYTAEPLTHSDLRDAVDTALRLKFAAGVVNDPSYPMQDGKAMHAFPCDTCAWIFGSKSDLAGFLSKYILHSAEAAPV